MCTDDVVAISLSDEDRTLLREGLVQWTGPARPTDDLARAMGFADREGLIASVEMLADSVERHEALRLEDWRRVLVATEICFVSDVFGAGVEWESVTGISDEDALPALRALQRKVLEAVSSATGRDWS